MNTWSVSLAVLLLLLISASLIRGDEKSPDGCGQFQKAFRDSCFEFPALRLSFLKAQRWCEERRGHLAFITDEDTQGFLQRHLLPGGDAWIGLTSTGQEPHGSGEGGLCWLDGSPVVFSKWTTPPPLTAVCGRMLGRSQFQWGAGGDCGQNLPFICQFDLQSAIVCADQNATLHCDAGRVVMIGQSFYGRHSPFYCRSSLGPALTPHGRCGWRDVTAAAAAECNGRGFCRIDDIISPFGEPCSDLGSYVSVHYRCLEGLTLSVSSTAAPLQDVSIALGMHQHWSQGDFLCRLDTGDGGVYHFSIQEGLEKNILHRYTDQSTFTVTATCTHGEVSISAQEASITIQQPVPEVEVIRCYTGNQSFTANQCTAQHGAELSVQIRVTPGSDVACRLLKEETLLSSLWVWKEDVALNITVSVEKVEQLGAGCHQLTLEASSTATVTSQRLQVCVLEVIVGLRSSITNDCSPSGRVTVAVWLDRGEPVKLLFHLLGINGSVYETRDMNSTRTEFEFQHPRPGLVRVGIKAWNDFSQEEVGVSTSCGNDSLVEEAPLVRVARSVLEITATPPEKTETNQSITLAINDPSKLDMIRYRYEWRCTQPCKCQGPFPESTHVIEGSCLPAPFEFFKYTFRELEADNQNEKSTISICVTLTALLDTSSARIRCTQGCDPNMDNTDAIIQMDCGRCDSGVNLRDTEGPTSCLVCQDVLWYTENPDDESKWPVDTMSCYKDVQRRPLIDGQNGGREYRVNDSTLALARSKRRDLTVVVITNERTPRYTTFTIKTRSQRNTVRRTSREESSEENNSKEKDSKEESSKEKDSKENDSKEKDSKEKDSKEESSKENDSKANDSKEKDSKEKDSKEESSKEKDSKEKDSKEESSKENDSKEKDSKEKDSKEESSKENDSKEKDSKEKDSKEKDSKEKDSKEKDLKEKDSKEKDSKEESSKENDSKEKDSKEKDSKEESSKENDSKEKDSKEKDSKEKDSKEKDSKEKDLKEKDSKEKDSKEESSKENDSKEKDSKEKDSKEESSKENDSKEKDAKEKDSKEKDSKEKDSKEESSKEKDSKEKDSKEKDSKEKDSKEESSKEKDSKEKDSKEKDSKEESSKEKDSKEKDSKEESSKEKDSKEKDSKEESSKEKDSKEKDSKEESSKEKDSKEKDSKEKDSKEKDSKEKDSKEESSKENDSKEKDSKEKDSKEKDSKEKDSKEKDSKEESSKENDSKEKDSKEKDSKEESSKENDSKEKDAKEKDAKEKDAKEKDSKEESSKENDSKEKDSKEKDSKEKDSKEKDSKEESSKEKDSKEKDSKEKDSKEESSKEKDSKEKDSKEKDSKEESSKEKDSKEKDSKEKDSKEKDSKEKDSKEKDSKEESSKEKDSKEKDSKEESSKEKDSKEESSKEKDSKEESSKENDSKEKDSKEKDSKENDSKEKDSKEESSKEKDSKEKDSKEKDSKDNDSKEKDSKEKDSKEKDSKEESSKEKDSKEKDSKEKSSKEKDSKEKDSKEKDSKEKSSKEKDSKEKDSKEKDSKEDGSKEKDSKEKDSKEKDSKEKSSKEKDSKEKDSKEKSSKEKDSKEKDSKEDGSKEKDSKEDGSKEKDSKEDGSKEKDSQKINSREKSSEEEPIQPLWCNIKPRSGTVLDSFTISCQSPILCNQSQICFRTDGRYLRCSDVRDVTSVFLPLGEQSCNYNLIVAATLKHGGDVLGSPLFTVQVLDSKQDAGSIDDLRRTVEAAVARLTERGLLSGETLGQLLESVAKKMNGPLYQAQKPDVEKLGEELLAIMAAAVEVVPAVNPCQVYVATRGLNAIVGKDAALAVAAQEQASSLYATLSSALLTVDHNDPDYNEQEMTTAADALVEGIGNMLAYCDNKKISDDLLSSLNDVQSALLPFKEIDDPPTIITKDGVCLLVKRVRKEAFEVMHPVNILQHSCASFYLPPLPDSILPSAGPLDVRMFSVDRNIYSWRKRGNISGTLGDLQLAASDGSVVPVKNLPEDIEMYLPRPAEQEVITSVLDLGNFSTVIIDVPQPDSTLVIKMMPSRDPLPFKVSLSYTDSTNKTSTVASTTMPRQGASPEERYTWLVRPESLTGRTGPHYLLVRPVVGNGIKSITGNLSVTPITASCKYWSPSTLDWKRENCRVGFNTSSLSIHCLCDHLTTFGGSFFVTPNLVDPSRSAELFATFAENPVVVGFIVALLVLYLLVLIWARWKDLKDATKVKVTLLQDNHPLDRYYYLLNINTGHRFGASTSSQVTITLLGGGANSEPHHLTDPKKPVFQRGASDLFLLSTPFSLGDLQAIRIWHDNSGDGPDWFLGTVSVQDVQTEQKWRFLCNCWLSVEQDDGSLDRVVPVSTELELKKFSHLFFLKTTRDFSDGHLWVSVVARPPSSTFTCVQRVSCCFSLLLCTMLTSIMFYGIPTDPSEQTLDMGHFEFTWQQFMVGVQSSLIMFPVNIIIVTLFRSARPRESTCCRRRKKPPTLEQVIHSSLTAAVDVKHSITLDVIIKDLSRLFHSLSPQSHPPFPNTESEPQQQHDINAVLSVMEDVVYQRCKTSESSQERLPPQDGALPNEEKSDEARYLFNQLGDIKEELVLLGPEPFPSIESWSRAVEQVQGMKKLLENQLVSCSSVGEEENLHKTWRSGVRGNTKQQRGCALPWWFVVIGWLLALASSAVSAYFTMLYGLKFGKQRSIDWLVSMIISFFQSLLLIQPLKVICMAVFFALVIKRVDEDEDDREVFLNENVGAGKDVYVLRGEAALYRPPPAADVERMRRRRTLGRKASALFLEILTYLGFLWMLLLVVYGQRDPNAFFLNQHIRRSFHRNTMSSMSVDAVFSWANTSLINNLFGLHRGFITDGNSKLVGNARLRQLRVHKNSCEISGYVSALVTDCRAPYSWKTEDTGSYGTGWSQPVADNSSSSSPWSYQSQDQLRAHPVWGQLVVYRGGGFVMELGPDLANASSSLEYLFRNQWLDVNTRALLVEFTVYNANVNLFCIVTLLLETAAVGAFQFQSELQAVRLYQSTGGLPIFVMAAEIIYLLFILYYMILQVKALRRQRWKYFINVWNLVELSIILLTWSAVAVFITRTVIGNQDMSYYQNHKDKFASFHGVAAADAALQYLMAFIVLLATVKLWRLLRLNAKMNMLTATLRRASGDILGFLLVMVIMLAAYSVTSNVIYGWKVSSYRTLGDAAMSVINLQVGMFDYSEVLDGTSVLAGLLFGSCVVFMTYVVINLLISVILEAFNQEQIHHQPSEEEEVVDVMLSNIFSLFGIKYKLTAETKTRSSRDEDEEQQ